MLDVNDESPMVRSRKSETKPRSSIAWARRAGHIGIVAQIVGAERESGWSHQNVTPESHWAAHDDRNAQIAGKITTLVKHGFAGCGLRLPRR